MRGQRRELIVGSAVSLLLLGWVLWRTDWTEVALRLREANLWLLLGAGLMVAAGVMARAWRWKIMLEAEAPAHRFSDLFDIVNLGYFANNLLPARLGDLLRGYLAGKWTPATTTFALSTTVVERVLDTLVVVVMLFALIPFLPVPPLAARAGLTLGFLFAVAALLLALAARSRDRFARVLRRVLRPLPLDDERWSTQIVALLEGFDLAREPRRLAAVLGTTVLVWAAAIASYWLTFRAFGLGLGVAASAFTISMAAIGMALPSGPAAAGTFDAAATWALELLRVGTALAGGVAIMLHIINFIAVSLLGLWSMARRGVTLGRLAEEATAAG